MVPSGKPYLTILEGTKWVTSPGNFTNVIKARANLLSANITQMEYCSQDSPYFDEFQCIKCDQQFDLKSLKCTTPPSNHAYDDNIHAYIPIEAGKETNSKALNIISSSPLVDNPNVTDCNLSNPYFDGIACIACPEPFTLFNTATKRCVTCEAD